MFGASTSPNFSFLVILFLSFFFSWRALLSALFPSTTVVATGMVCSRDISFRMFYELFLRKIENSCQNTKQFDVYFVYL